MTLADVAADREYQLCNSLHVSAGKLLAGPASEAGLIRAGRAASALDEAVKESLGMDAHAATCFECQRNEG